MTAPDRATQLDRLSAEHFDVLVVGGGITGCGIARDAALRGLRVALLEREDFASGTSSRSSRLVHGGVRYLEHGHLGLVFEASAERRRLLRLAPHLVRPLAFTWPVYRGARVPGWKLAAGLALYDALSLFRNVARHRRLARQAVAAREPGLRREALRGGAVYYDAATNDSRLTLANAIGAAEAGALVLNHVVVGELTRADGRVTGARATDVFTGREVMVRARVVVRAMGPWTSGAVRGSTGVHVTVARARVGNAGALTLTAPQDGRVMFVLPAGAHTIIGTTESATTGSPDDVRATERDVRYLLEATNHYFPDAKLAREDVVSAWAGVRPLVAASGSLASASREHHVAREPGLVTITGGKLTTYRVMAAEAVAVACAELGITPERQSPTADAPLPGGEIANVAAECEAAWRDTALPAEVAERLVHDHGSRWREVWAVAAATTRGVEPLVPGLPYLRGEAVYAARHEMAGTVGDVLIRRTHLAFEVPDQGRSIAADVATLMGDTLGWSDDRRAREGARYAAEAERMFGVEP